MNVRPQSGAQKNPVFPDHPHADGFCGTSADGRSERWNQITSMYGVMTPATIEVNW